MMPSRMIRRDIVIPQGKYWEWPMRLMANGALIDTAQWSARMQVRRDYADTGAPVILDLTKANGRVQTGIMARTPDPVNLVLTLPHTVDYAAWPQNADPFLYEVEITNASGVVLDIGFWGYATLQREVVR